MAKYDYDLIVIGGGAGGLTASTGAGQLGAKTLLIEKEKELGGDCLHYGCVPSKSLIKSAYTYNVLKHSQKYGLPKVDVPEVDFKNVSERIHGVIGTILKHDSPEYIKDHYNVDTKFGQAQFLNNHTIALNGESITAKNFILATGSSAFIPSIDGLSDVPYITNVQLFSLKKLPESLIVLGGGPIGTEMAQAFCRLGSKVTVVEIAPCVLAREDEDISCFMQEELKKEGVRFHIETKAIRAGKNDTGVNLTVVRDGKESIIEAESLLVATGRKPNVEGLNLEKAGVEFGKRGIKVDSRLRTTSKNISAIGDVNGSFPFTHVAGYEGGIAMMNAIVRLPLKVDYTNVPWCTYLDPEVASIGYNEMRAKEAKINYKIHIEEFQGNDRALAEGETVGFIKIVMDKKERVIGVQIVGYHAGDLIHQWITAINGKVSLSTIAQSIHAYPTLSEISKMASGNILAPKLFNNFVRKILRGLFGLQGKVEF